MQLRKPSMRADNWLLSQMDSTTTLAVAIIDDYAE